MLSATITTEPNEVALPLLDHEPGFLCKNDEGRIGNFRTIMRSELRFDNLLSVA